MQAAVDKRKATLAAKKAEAAKAVTPMPTPKIAHTEP